MCKIPFSGGWRLAGGSCQCLVCRERVGKLLYNIFIMKKLFFILLSVWMLAQARSQTSAGFGTVLVESSNPDYESLPVINLRSSDYLTVSFDDLQDRDMALRYRVVHLNTDGTLSPLREIEYMDGINKTDITDVNLSFNTRTNYVHYEFRFPEGRRNVKVSGAFCFEIFEASDPGNVMLRIPFMVCEPSVLVDVDVKVEVVLVVV